MSGWYVEKPICMSRHHCRVGSNLTLLRPQMAVAPQRSPSTCRWCKNSLRHSSRFWTPRPRHSWKNVMRYQSKGHASHIGVWPRPQAGAILLVQSKDGAGKRVRGRTVHQTENVLVVIIRVHVHGQNRTENLLQDKHGDHPTQSQRRHSQTQIHTIHFHFKVQFSAT